MELVPCLSALTPDVVDTLYNSLRPLPQEEPVFLFLVGAPGSGKSSGHGHALEAGLLPGDYATLNLDTLLESLAPFRAASSIAHFLKSDTHHDKIKFSSIGAYRSRKEDLDLFKAYDELSEHSFDRVRETFRPYQGKRAPHSLLELNDMALKRAIDRRIPIVYETTLSVSKEGRVNKVDDIMHYLKRTPYRVVFYHIRGDPDAVADRLHSRQEHETTQGPYPFYRYVPATAEAATKYVRESQAAFDTLKRQYKKALFQEFENPMSPGRRPSENRRSASTRKRQILRAYSDRSNLYVSPPSSDIFKLSSSESGVRNK